jgi:hypothetical protein
VTKQPATEQIKEEHEAPVVAHEEEVIIAQLAPVPADSTPPAENESAPASLPDTLPQTAGNLASIPLLGVVLLSGGFATIRFATKQS